MVKVNMTGVGAIVEEGQYDKVVLTKVSERKQKRGERNGDLVMFQATIRDGGEFDGKMLNTAFFFDAAPDADNETTKFYLQQTLLAFGADEEDVTSSDLDPVELGKELYGNSGVAQVVHTKDTKAGSDRIFVNAKFFPSEF